MTSISNSNCYSRCKYQNKCIKPCQTSNPNYINSVLVRSREANDQQKQNKRLVGLEKRMNILERICENKTNSVLSPITNKFCNTATNPGLLVKSQEAMMYQNWTKRINVLYNRMNRLAILTDSVFEIDAIAITFRFQPGVVRYNICKNIDIMEKRIKKMEEILENL